MKQALLITAYKNPQHLIRLIDLFDDNFLIYIHIDSKSNFTNDDLLNLRRKSQVKFVSNKYRVQWGSINHLKAFLLLAEEAIKDDSIEYVHTITGHDYPIKSAQEITRFMENNKGTLFIQNHKLPFDGWIGGGLDRILYYQPHDFMNVRVYRNYKIKERILSIQQNNGIKRGFPACFPVDKYGGLVYWSIPIECVRYILDFNKKNPQYLRRFKYTYCSEEIFFQTIIMNSPYKSKVCDDNLRFMVWEKRNGNNPANLDERDFDAIKSSNALFARKFEYPVSQNLLDKIDEELLK